MGFLRSVGSRWFAACLPKRQTVLLAPALIMVFGLTAVWLGAVGTTRYVDDATCPAAGSGTSVNPFCRIQDAICVAVSGDTVSVAPGSYTEAIRMRPGVSVISQGGAAVTTINAANQPCTDTNFCAKRVGNQCSVVTFASGHTPSTSFEGFTVSGGAGLIQSNRVAGGGIYVFSSPTILNNVITNNVLSGPLPQGGDVRGAGVYVATGSPLISNNTISGNRAVAPAGTSQATTFGYGGGVWVGFASSPTVTNNVIEGNVAGDPALAYSLGAGGGVVVFPNAGTISPVVDRNLVADNIADGTGGGIAVETYVGTVVEAVVTNNVVVGNAARFGGGVYTYFAKSRTANNTITGNDAFLGGGLYSGQSETAFPVTITNNIIEGNTLRDFGNGGGIYTLDLSTTFDPLIDTNDLWGNERNQCGGERTDATCIGVQGNFSSDPRFQNRAGRNYHLDPNSPAIDRGNPSNAPGYDFDSHPRGVDGNGTPNNPSSGDIDVGAFEFSGACVPVAETCDSLDNNCNFLVDDGLGSTTCGVGVCQATVQNCVAGNAQSCTPGTPSAETCDGLDNNCNGTLDDGLGSTICGVGVCQVTTQNCVGGVSQSCTPGSPTAEICDGFDNDCNGVPDNGLGNTTCGLGVCQVTVQNCVAGNTQTCTPGAPVAETCDGLDNNCNGTPDDGLGNTTCGVGACQATVQNCVAGSTQTCTPGTPLAETCDGLDNDCNGIADDGFPNQDGDALPDCMDPDDDNDSVLDAGDCAPLDPAAFAWPSEISGVDLPVAAPTTIVYDQQSIGSGAHYEIVSGLLGRLAATRDFTEGFCLVTSTTGGSWVDLRQAPVLGEGWYYMVRSANGCGLGTLGTPLRDAAGSGDVCQIGRVDSDADGSPDDLDCSPGNPAISPNQPEICDGVDNNCDLAIDENNPGGGLSCGSNVGTCTLGLTVCSAGALTCNGAVGPAPETCDSLDNDCDGIADNNAPDFDLDGLDDCVDPDDDNDATADGADCAPLDAGAFAPTSEVADLDMVDGAPYLLQWIGQSVGSATLYDLGGGSINISAFDFATGACLASTGATMTTDPRPTPPEGEGWYYLVKARNVCGAGTYGTAARDALPACP